MKRRLLLLLCLMVTAGSAAWAEIAHGTCKNGTWVIDDNGKLTVNIDGQMHDYKQEGSAPWYDYWEDIKAIHISSGCKNIGQHAFHGLNYVESVTGGENVEGVGYYAFEECGAYAKTVIPEIKLPKCTYVGEGGFRSCGAVRIVLPVVTEVRRKAFYSCPNLRQVDLGSKIESIGVLAFSECPQMWVDNSPNIFMSNPTPPTLWTKVEASTGDKIKTFFKDLGMGLGMTVLSLVPFVSMVTGYSIGQATTYHNIQDAAENGDLEFAWDGLRYNGSSGDMWDLAIDQPFTMSSLYENMPSDQYYNPFAPKPDGRGWTDGQPIICVPANLVQTYRDYYVDRTVKSENRGYICDHYKGMGANSRIGYGAIMAGGALGSSLSDGWWMLQCRKATDELDVNPLGTGAEDALVLGGDLRSIGMSAVSGLKNQVKALFIGCNSKFPDGAFQGWTNLEYVSMGNGSYIPFDMFKGCTGLKQVDSYAYSLGKSAFEGCTNLYKFNGGKEMINVEACAFKGCTRLYEVKLPRVKTIQNEAFMGCSYLRSVFSSGLLSEGLSAQYDINYIGESAFEGCTNLQDVSLQNLENLGKRAFYGCKTFFEFSPGQYFSTVPEEAFANSGIQRIILNGVHQCHFESRSFADVTLLANTGYSTKDRGIFDGNGNYGRIADDIASDAFGDLELKDIPLHCSYEAYARYENHKMLSQMKFEPYDVDYMRWTVDKNGWELTSSGILTVGKNYNSIAIYKTKAEEYDWYPYRDLIKKVLVEDGVKTIYKSEFEGLTRVVDVHIPRSVTTINESAFKGCTSLKNIYITRVENIGSYAFEGCSSLQTIELDEKLKNAGDYIFKNCTSLTDITNKEETPATITNLTFKDIKSPAYDVRRRNGAPLLASDAGAATVELHVPRYAVLNYMIDDNWNKLHIAYADDRGTWQKAGKFGDGSWILYDDGTMVVCANEGMPESGYATNFYNTRGAQLELKFAADPDNPTDTDPMMMVKRLEIDGNIAELGAYFANFKNLEEVVMKAPVTKLYRTFKGCEKLKEINLSKLEYIGNESFMGTAITSAVLTSATTVRNDAFKNCAQLTTVQFGTTCDIQSNVFENCTSLTHVDLSTASINSANKNIFKGCTALSGVIFHGTTVVSGMFEGCTALEEIDLGENITSIGKYAFGGCSALKTIYVSSPTPPVLMNSKVDVTIGGTTQSKTVSAFTNDSNYTSIDHTQIEVQVPNTFIIAYTSAMRYLWREMKIVKDEDYDEELLPTYGSLSGFDTKWNRTGNGSWRLDTEGLFVIDCTGDMAAYRSKGKDNVFASDRYWYNTFAPWLYFIKTVEVTDEVTSVPDYMFAQDMEDVANSSAGVTTVILGEKFHNAGYAAFPFSGIKDVYIYSEDYYSVFNPSAFNREAVVANNATLHVLKDVDDRYLEHYKGMPATRDFPNIVADLDPKDPKVQAITFDMAELTMYVGQSIQLEPQFTPSNVKDKTLRYKNLLPSNNVYIDENGVMTAWDEGYAYIEAYSSYTIDGEELQATWGPDKLTYLKVTITAEPQKDEIFFDVFAYSASDAPWTTFHVLRDEHIDVDTDIKTCEVAGYFNEDDITTQAIPEWQTGTIVLPEEAEGFEVVRVGAFAFYERGIRTLVIPWTVTQIGYNACARCDYLTDVYIQSFKPLAFTDPYGDPMEEEMGHNYAFDMIGGGDDGEGYATLHVPAGSKDAWDIYPWNEWFRYIVEDAPLPDGINEVKNEEIRVKNEGSWFDLSGRKLGSSRPTKPGLYIIGGKKVVVK